MEDDEREALEDQMAAGGWACGSAKVPVSMEQSSYWSSTSVSGVDEYVIRASGSAGGATRTLEVVVRRSGSPVYDSALFAGNKSGDEDYVLDLGGFGLQADEVDGDVYSGGGVDLAGDSTVTGVVRALGIVTPMGGGVEGIEQNVPDITGMNYATKAQVNVANEFATGGATYKSDDAGGKAWQLPQANAAHIFRKNPSDRSSENSSTAKDDYYLEDPYETVRQDASANGSDAYKIKLSASGNDKVYFIDGNLWVHNYQTFSFKFDVAGGGPTKVVFVVKGNVYFSDNLFYKDKSTDGVAFIAMADDAVADSGNIYFGDPSFGTLEEMHAFMYAENNFYDTNLSAVGSASVRVFGNMTAGNQVLIDRDFGLAHSKLTVDFDDRISTGALTMPMLSTAAEGAASFEVVSWREVPND
jgi:hypothetical protein